MTKTSRQQWPTVLVSRREHPDAVSTAAGLRRRLRAGAQTVAIDTAGELIELADADLAGSTRPWTLRITGSTRARISLELPLPRSTQIMATDASFVEMTGPVVLHAYTRATVHAFGRGTVYARGRSTVLACDHTEVSAQEEAEVFGYDWARIRAQGRSRAVCVGVGELYVEGQVSGLVADTVAVQGPARANVEVYSPTAG